MVNISNYEHIPSEKERVAFYDWYEKKYENLCFDIVYSPFDTFNRPVNEVEADYWKSEYDWKILNLTNNYLYMWSYYEKGIPDSESYAELRGEKFAFHYWFSYHAESLLHRIIGAFDLLHQIINAKYELKIENEFGFNGKVRNEIRKINPQLYQLIKKVHKDPRFITGVDLRNNFTHNNAPSNLSSGITRELKGIIAIGKGSYTSSESIKNAIVDLMDYLTKTKKQLEVYL
ncbi:MAG: Cthe_2314 family HEPN domain-containing protein [Solibacillus sp.]